MGFYSPLHRKGEPLPKSWHKHQEPQLSPDERPGPKKPKVRIRLVWDEGDPSEHWLPWRFEDDAAAHAFIEEWRSEKALEVDDPAPAPPWTP
jgi:hypothetical protein